MNQWLKSAIIVAALESACGSAFSASAAMEQYASDVRQSCLAYVKEKNPQAPAASSEICECFGQKYQSLGDDEGQRVLAGDKELRSRLDGEFALSCVRKISDGAAQERKATEKYLAVPTALPNLLETKSGVYYEGRLNKRISGVVEDNAVRTILALASGAACFTSAYPLRSMGRLDAGNELKLTMLLRLMSEDQAAALTNLRVSKVRNMPARLFDAATKNETLGKISKNNFYGAYVVDETNDAGLLAICWNDQGTKTALKEDAQDFISGMIGSARRY